MTTEQKRASKLLKRVSFYPNNKVKRNAFAFDCGLHTQHLKMKNGEQDMEFVTRYLLQYFKGCKRRGSEYKKFYLSVEDGDNYCNVWGVKSRL